MHVDGSRLVRLLSGLASADGPGSRQSFAERLGEWLAVTDALPLSSVLNVGAAGGATGSERLSSMPAQRSAEAKTAFDRVRDALVASMSAGGTSSRGKAGIGLPVPEPDASVESAADFAPYRRYYFARQRDMRASIGPLRANVRAALARQSPRLRQLAALDAVLDHALADRERSLLATVPGLLARRFEQSYETHQANLAVTRAADDPARWMAPDGWLAAFCTEMQGVLLAELDLRLQPVAGLVAALDNEQGNDE